MPWPAAPFDENGPLRPGDMFLGKYEIRSAIGAGGYATVYLAHHTWAKRDFAIKILHRKGRGLTDELLYRGRTEAEVLMNDLRHPNIVEVTDAGIQDGVLYMIMEHLQGRSLRAVLHDYQRLTVAEALELLATVGETMHFAHTKRVLHRDLKPDNLFITPGNALKVLDFGIAKILGPNRWKTRKNLLVGTFKYLSPEQLLGLGAASPMSEVYALGQIAFEALVGKHMCDLARPTRDPRELTAIHARFHPPRLDELDPRIPPYVADFVQRAISKRPEQRFPTALAFAQEASACLRSYEEDLARRGKYPIRRDLWRVSIPDEAPTIATPVVFSDGTVAESGSADAPALSAGREVAFGGAPTTPGTTPAKARGGGAPSKAPGSLQKVRRGKAGVSRIVWPLVGGSCFGGAVGLLLIGAWQYANAPKQQDEVSVEDVTHPDEPSAPRPVVEGSSTPTSTTPRGPADEAAEAPPPESETPLPDEPPPDTPPAASLRPVEPSPEPAAPPRRLPARRTPAKPAQAPPDPTLQRMESYVMQLDEHLANSGSDGAPPGARRSLVQRNEPTRGKEADQ